jgi:AraC-like DNA-binding protein
MDDVDALIRGAAIGITLLLAAAFLRARPNASLAWIGTLYLGGFVGYLLWGHPAILTWPPLARLVFGVLALSTPFFFWALARLIFEDGFRLRPVHWALLGVIVIAGVAQAVLPGVRILWLPNALRIGFRLLSLALIVHVFWLVWSGWSVDLVEKRHRLRLGFLVVVGIAAALVVLAALFYAPAASRAAPIRLGEAVASLVLSLSLAIAVLRFDRDFLPPESAPALSHSPSANPGNDASAEGAAGTSADPDASLMARLDALMQHDEAWRETGLSIGGLAARVGAPEYRLRRLINQRLGFRNFTAFLNEYRLTAAAARLADREQLRIPVLTIALELGWGSIGPFNRAFRTRFDMTPSDYRRKHTTGSGPTDKGSPIP